MTDEVRICIDGRPLSVPPGTTVAAAIARAGVARFLRSVLGQPRGPLCGMGICMECHLTINGQSHCRSCQRLCEQGMEVHTDPSGERRSEAGGRRPEVGLPISDLRLQTSDFVQSEPALNNRTFEFEIVVVGGGPAGVAAACAAAESGRRVAVVDDTPWLGGQIWRGQQNRRSESGGRSSEAGCRADLRSPTSDLREPRRWLERFRNCGATLLDRTSVIASSRPGLLLAEHASGPRQIRWQRLVLATGARELFLPFPGWTLPGVMGPGGLQAQVKNGWPICGKRVVVAGSGPLLLAVADGLKRRGAQVMSIDEQAPLSQVMRFGVGLWAVPDKLWQGALLKARLLGVPYRCGVWPVRAEGNEQVQRVLLTDGRSVWTEECDLLACGFGLTPNVELPLALGCQVGGQRSEGTGQRSEAGPTSGLRPLTSGVCVFVNDWQATTASNVYCAGEPTGIGGADCALVEGQIAGYAASDNLAKAETLFGRRARWHRFRAALARAFALRDELKFLASDDTLLCRCEDVTLGRMRQFSSWREAKLQSRCGMGSCQGRVCGAAAEVILGWGMESVRPPVLPARVQSLVSQGDHGQRSEVGDRSSENRPPHSALRPPTSDLRIENRRS